MTSGGRVGPVLAVSGLAAESRIAAAGGIETVAGGGDVKWLAAAIERQIADGARAIISFGIAGALVPGLRPGSLIVARAVSAVGDATTLEADPAWSRRLREVIAEAISADIAGSDSVVSNQEQKAELGRLTGAVAVDMESHVAARIAAAHGLPFAALRAVADPVDRCVPSAAAAAMVAGGGVAAHRAVLMLLRHPGQLPALMRVAFDARCALGALARGRRRLGDRLGRVDLDELALHVV